MIVETRIENNYVVVYPEGRLDLNTSQLIEKELIRIIDTNEKHLVVNMKNVEYLHSSGIRLLIAMRNRLLDRGKTITICEINETVMKIIEFVDLQGIIHICSSENEAVEYISTF